MEEVTLINHDGTILYEGNDCIFEICYTLEDYFKSLSNEEILKHHGIDLQKETEAIKANTLIQMGGFDRSYAESVSLEEFKRMTIYYDFFYENLMNYYYSIHHLFSKK